MKVESKWFLSAISAFVVVAFVTVCLGFTAFKSNNSKSVNTPYVSSIVKIGNIE